MKTSARNRFSGAVLAIHTGPINDEVDIILDGSGTKLTAVVSRASTKTLGLEPGKKVIPMVKASGVILVMDEEGIKFSPSNQLGGTVVAVMDGAVNSEVRVRLNGGEALTTVITVESVKALELGAGSRVVALIKGSDIILGVPM